MTFVMEEQMITIGGTLVLGILILAFMIYRQISQIMREKNRRNQILKEMRQETKPTNFEQKEETKGTPMKQPPPTQTTEEEEVIESNEVSFKAPQEVRQEEIQEEVNTSITEIPMPKLKFNQEYVSEVKNKFESLTDKIEEKISSISTPFVEKVAPRQEIAHTEISRAQHNDSMDDFESYEDFNLHPGHSTKSLFEVNQVNDVVSYSNSESISPLKVSKVEESVIEDTCERQESEEVQQEPLTILNKVFEEMDSNEDSDYEQRDNEDESAEEELDEISSEVEEDKIDFEREEIKESIEEEQFSVESPPKRTSTKRQSTFKEPITPKARSSRKSENKENETPSKTYSAKKTPKTVGSVRTLRDRKSIKTPIRYGEYY